MTGSPAGRLVPDADGSKLVVGRVFRAPVEDVWAEDLPTLDFDDYYPAMKAHYEALA